MMEEFTPRIQADLKSAIRYTVQRFCALRVARFDTHNTYAVDKLIEELFHPPKALENK